MRSRLSLIACLLVCALAPAQTLKRGTLKRGTLHYAGIKSGGGGGGCSPACGVSLLPGGIGWHTLSSANTGANTDLFPLIPSSEVTDPFFPSISATDDGGYYLEYAYSGGAADPVHNRFIIWGGGHDDYCGNEVYDLDLSVATPVVERLNNPTSPTACQKSVTAPTTPTTSVSTSSGSLPAGTYQAEITYIYGHNTLPYTESVVSPPSTTATGTLSSAGTFTVNSPASATGVTGWNVFISSTGSNYRLQNATPIAIGTPWTQSSALLTTSNIIPNQYYTRNFVEALPTTVGFDSYGGCTGSGCRPNARHTLDSLVYIAHANVLFSVGNEISSAGGLHSNAPWALDMGSLYSGYSNGGSAGGDAATNWTRLDTTLTYTSGSTHLPDEIGSGGGLGTGWGDVMYEPSSHLVWILNGAMYKYDYDGSAGLGVNTIAQVGNYQLSSRDNQMQGAYDPDHRWWWFFGGATGYSLRDDTGHAVNNGVNYLDLNACAGLAPGAAGCNVTWVGNTYVTTDRIGGASVNHYVPTGCDGDLYTSANAPTSGMVGTPPFDATQNPGVAWDPIWHVFVIWQNSTITYNVPERLYLFNPDPSSTVNINALGVATVAPQTCASINTSSWTETTGPLPAQASGSNSLGVYGRFAYFPALDVFAICHGYVNCKYLRLRDDSVTITDTSGAAQTNRPVSIPRVFRDGEIPNFPQPYMSGQTIATWQADVKNRYADGSVQFAIVSAVVPSIAANSAITVSIKNSTNRDSGDTGNHNPTGFLAQADMLSTPYNFDAHIAPVGTITPTAISARAMLNAGKWTYWLQGPVVTAVRIADEATRAYDVNIDGGSGTPLHPIFEAWFYPQGHYVDVGYALENAWLSSTASKSARDQKYSFTLTAGNTSPTTVFTQTAYTHIGWSRWHKDYWITQPPSIHIDFNNSYLATTKAIPNWDITRPVATAVNNYKNGWNSAGAWQLSLSGQTQAPLASTLSLVTAGSMTGQGTMYVRTTLVTPSGETNANFSGEPSKVVPDNQELVVSAPADPSGTATGWNVYISNSSGTEKLQNGSPIAMGSNYTQTSTLSTTGATPPTAASLCAVPGGQSSLVGLTYCIGNIELQPNSGGDHTYVGLQPSWNVLYYLTMDDTLRQEMLTNADLAGYFPIHFREADANAGSGKFFDAPTTGTIGTEGRFVSVNARQVLSFSEPTSSCGQTGAMDDAVLSGTVTQGNWPTFGQGGGQNLTFPTHFPDIGYFPYIFTGKEYYLEELQFQAANNPGIEGGCTGNTSISYKYHQGYLGLFSGESLRETGWGLRTMAYAAFISPDGSPEKAYLTQKMDNNVAFLDGSQGLPNEFINNAESTAAYNYGKTWIYGVAGLSLPFFAGSDPFISPAYGYTGQGALLTSCGGAESNFQEAYLTLGLSQVRDLTGPGSALINFLVRRNVNIVLNSSIGNIYLIGDNAGGDVAGYAYCQRNCTTWTANGNPVSPPQDAGSVGGSCTTQGNFINYASNNWSTYTSVFASTPSAWNSPNQMEDNFTGEVSSALSMGGNTLVPDGDWSAHLAYDVLHKSAASLFANFSTMTPKWDIRPRQ